MTSLKAQPWKAPCTMMQLQLHHCIIQRACASLYVLLRPDLANCCYRKSHKMKNPPPFPCPKRTSGRLEAVFLASHYGHCNGASVPWDISHIMLFFFCFLWVLGGRHWQVLQSSFVAQPKQASATLDKAAGYHTNLHALLPCWKAHRTCQHGSALPEAPK